MFRFLALVITVSFFHLTAATAQVSTQDMGRFLDRIGFDLTFDGMQGNVESGADQFGIPDNMRLNWRFAANHHFDASEMNGSLAVLAAPLFDEDELALLNDLYSDPLAEKVTALEAQSQAELTDDERQIEGKALIAALRNNDPSRVNLYQDMQTAIGDVDSGVAFVMNFQTLIISAMVRASGTTTVTEDQILTMVAGQEPQIRTYMVDSVFNIMASTYQDLSDEDVAGYILLLGQPVVIKLYQQTEALMGQILTHEFRDFSDELAEMPLQSDL